MTDIVDRLNASLSVGYSELRKEAAATITRLRAKIKQMEQQEPVAKVRIHQTGGNAGIAWSAQPLNDFDSLPPLRDGDKLYTLPGAQAQPAPDAPDDVIEQAVNRFLSWKLPKDFHPDGGVAFIPTKGRGYDSPHWPIGTNLFNAEQAREMLRYVLAAAPEAKCPDQ